MTKIDVVAHIHALAGHEHSVLEAIKTFVAPTRLEAGCLRYDLFRDVSDPTKFTFIEEWESPAHLEAHSASTHIAAGRALLQGKLAEPTWVQVVKAVE
jgi:quinol monooxygenase YgiN